MFGGGSQAVRLQRLIVGRTGGHRPGEIGAIAPNSDAPCSMLAGINRGTGEWSCAAARSLRYAVADLVRARILPIGVFSISRSQYSTTYALRPDRQRETGTDKVLVLR